MKIKFTQEDSLYKIFKTIEKIHVSKKIEIFIDSKNSFFENIWWGKQLLDLLNSKSIEYVFLYEDSSARAYYENLGVDAVMIEKNIAVKYLRKIYEFFFIARNYHGTILKKGTTVSYIIIFLEIIFVVGLFYFFYGLISPSANVYIKPSYNIDELVYNFRYYPSNKASSFNDSKYISIPYYTGVIDLKYNLSTAVSNIKYLQKPSKGTIILYNTSDKPYSLVGNTKIVTEDGILYKTMSWINIPASSGGTPSTTEVGVEAYDTDEKGNIIGDRGNIAKDTKVYIKNLKDSFYMKKVYGVAKQKFTDGSTTMNGSVDQKDIDFLKDKLADYVRKNKISLLREKLQSDNDKVILSFDDTVGVGIGNYDIQSNPGDVVANVQGSVNASIKYKYVLWSDFEKAYDSYIQQRVSDHMHLEQIDKNSLLFYDKTNLDDVYVIPTKVDIIWGYNFGNDINGIKDEIKSKIIGKHLDEAQQLILDYPEIDVAVIKLYPAWYSILPRLKSRINIQMNK